MYSAAFLNEVALSMNRISFRVNAPVANASAIYVATKLGRVTNMDAISEYEFTMDAIGRNIATQAATTMRVMIVLFFEK